MALENLMTVFVTGNGCTVSPDMRRRSLFVKLFMEDECAEDRKFKRVLDDATVVALCAGGGIAFDDIGGSLTVMNSTIIGNSVLGCPVSARGESLTRSLSFLLQQLNREAHLRDNQARSRCERRPRNRADALYSSEIIKSCGVYA